MDFQRLRRAAFACPFELDADILRFSAGLPSHGFLCNPAAHGTYLYLTDYVMALSQAVLNRPAQELRVLDWGSGKGHVSLLMRKRGVQLTSCDMHDPDDDDSTFGQSTPIVEGTGLSVVPLTHPFELPFPTASFDVALSFGVLEHVSDQDGSLRELRRVLRPDGLFFCFNLPSKLSWTQALARLRGNIYHDRLYDEATVGAMLAATGFEPLDVWRRQLFPKNSLRYPCPQWFEHLDQWLCEHTPLRALSTSVEFVARAGYPIRGSQHSPAIPAV